MISPNASYAFKLATDAQLCAALYDLRMNDLVRDDDERDDAYEELELALEMIAQIENAIYSDPRLLSDGVLGGLFALAMDSPHRDISEDKAGGPHKGSPEQDLALRALRSLSSLNFFLVKGCDRVISRLEIIAQNSQDRDIRIEAVRQLFANAPHAPHQDSPAVMALHSIALSNSDVFTRIEARHELMVLGQERQFSMKASASPKP